MLMPNLRVVLALALAAGALLPACGDQKEADNRPARARLIERDPANAERPMLVLGSKGFTEQLILVEIYSQALEAAGYRVRRGREVPSARAALAALTSGEIDGYPEYTGTALNSLFGEDLEDLPKDPARAYTQARTGFAREGLVALPPTPFENSNGFAMLREAARNLGVTTLSGLEGEASDLVLSGPPECARRADCLLGLERTYGLRFEDFLPVDISARHRPVIDEKADVGVVFTTDGEIRTENLTLLTDDQRMLPPYNVTLVVREEALRAAGRGLRRVVTAVQRGLTLPVMQELNSRVDLDGETPAAVAYGYLREVGYVE
jgi:glycine betaine/choline ABC-type transport system substrate-binding protein